MTSIEVGNSTVQVGSREEAYALLEAWLKAALEEGDFIQYGLVHSQLPKGWEYLGSGSSRESYKAPSGIVYKIRHRSRWDTSATEKSNRAEYKALTGLADKPWAPPISMYEFEVDNLSIRPNSITVLATPFYENDGTSLSEEGHEQFDEINQYISDIFYNRDNYKVRNGLPIVVDAGYPR